MQSNRLKEVPRSDPPILGKHQSGVRPIAKELPEGYPGLAIRHTPLTHHERTQMYAMRFEVYCKMGSFLREEYPDELEHDEYDQSAIHFISTLHSHVVGTLRLIFEQRGRFLMEDGEEGFSLPGWIPRQATCEISRIAAGRFLDPVERQRVRQFPLLAARACQWSLDHGYRNWIAAFVEPAFHILTQDGWPMVLLGPARTYHRITAVPVAINLEDLWYVLTH